MLCAVSRVNGIGIRSGGEYGKRHLFEGLIISGLQRFLGSLLICIATIAYSALAAQPTRPAVTAAYSRSAGPMAVKMAAAFGQTKSDSESASVPLGPDAQACVMNFAAPDAKFDAVVVQQWPVASADDAVAQLFQQKPGGGVYLIGERRLAVIVNSRNDIKSIRMTSLHRILAAVEGDKFYALDKTRDLGKEWPLLGSSPAVWNEFGWSTAMPVHVYAEGASSWSRETLTWRCMKRIEWSLGYYRWGCRPFRKDISECMDGEDVIVRVRHDPLGIGFVQYTGQKSLKGVKVLAVEDDFPQGWPGDYDVHGTILPLCKDGTVDVFAWEQAAKAGRPNGPIAMKLSPELQPEYPLSEPLLLYVHPKAPENVKAFARFCVSEQGAAVAESLSFITPRQHFALLQQRRLLAVRKGKCPTLQVCADSRGRRMLKDLALAYTKEVAPLRIECEVENTEHLDELFADPEKRFEMMVGGERHFKDEVERMKDETGKTQSDSSSRLQPSSLSLPLGMFVAAVVGNDQLGKEGLSWQEFTWIISGKLRDWRAAGVADGRLEENAIEVMLPEDFRGQLFHLVMRKANVPAGRHVTRTQNDQETLAQISVNPSAIGVVSILSLPKTPEELKKQHLKILTLTDATHAVRPERKDIFAGNWPLCEGVFLYLHPKASEDARRFAHAIAEEPALREVVARWGLMGEK